MHTCKKGHAYIFSWRTEVDNRQCHYNAIGLWPRYCIRWPWYCIRWPWYCIRWNPQCMSGNITTIIILNRIEHYVVPQHARLDNCNNWHQELMKPYSIGTSLCWKPMSSIELWIRSTFLNSPQEITIKDWMLTAIGLWPYKLRSRPQVTWSVQEGWSC